MSDDIVEVCARAICCPPEGDCQMKSMAGRCCQNEQHGTAENLLAALEAAGYAVVPVVPTGEMIDAGAPFCEEDGNGGCAASAEQCYAAMLKASA